MEKIATEFASGAGNSCLHPLLIPTVLNKVFGSLTFWHQKKCRLVCRIWDLELRPHIRKQSKVNLTKLIHERIDLSVELINMHNICTSFILDGDYPSLKSVLTRLPVKYLELRNVPWTLPYLQDLLLLLELPQLEELRLPVQMALPAPPSIGNGQQGVIQLPFIDTARKCSNLKTVIVTLTIQDFQTYHNKNSSIDSLVEIIRASPNLEEIFYPNIVQFTSPLENPARILLENLLTKPELSLRNLSTLKIDTFLCDRDFDLLIFKGFPLKSLQITLTPNVTTRKFYDFLYAVEETLQSLTLTFRDGFRLEENFPTLTNLGWMSIIVWRGYLDFVHRADKLKTLVVVLVEFEREMMNQIDDWNIMYNKYGGELKKRTSLNQLEIHAAGQGSQDTIYKLLHIDTMITKLTMDNVSDKYLRMVFRSLPALQEFAILYGGFSETGITGIPMEFLTNDLWNREFYATELKKFPAISDLKCLRVLVLSGEISDFSIIFGVAKCRNLKSLEIVGRFSCAVTDRSLRKIANCMDLHFLRTKNLSHITEEGILYTHERMAGREIYLNV